MDDIKVHIEMVSGILRLYSAGRTYEQGDQYDWAGTLVHVGEDEVEIRGVTKAPTIEQARAIQEGLRQAGYTKLKVERWVAGRRWIRKHVREGIMKQEDKQ